VSSQADRFGLVGVLHLARQLLYHLHVHYIVTGLTQTELA
jgi:hypothetical protein